MLVVAKNVISYLTKNAILYVNKFSIKWHCLRQIQQASDYSYPGSWESNFKFNFSVEFYSVTGLTIACVIYPWRIE